MNKFLLTIFILTVTFIIPSIAQANLLVNPNFETGDLSGWAVDFNGPNIGVVATNPQNASFHARNFYDGGRYQWVGITGGQEYRLTGWAYVPSGGSGSWGSYIEFKVYNSQSQMLAIYPTNMDLSVRDRYAQWETGWVMTPPNATVAKIRFGTWFLSDAKGVPLGVPANPTDFDNFDFSPIPEPTSLTLLGSGFVGLLFLRKRSR